MSWKASLLLLLLLSLLFLFFPGTGRSAQHVRALRRSWQPARQQCRAASVKAAGQHDTGVHYGHHQCPMHASSMGSALPWHISSVGNALPCICKLTGPCAPFTRIASAHLPAWLPFMIKGQKAQSSHLHVLQMEKFEPVGEQSAHSGLTIHHLSLIER